MQSQKILADLKIKGFKMTSVRQGLVEVLCNHSDPLSIIQILQCLEKKDLKPNKTTIYREIEFLKESAILEEVELGDGKKRYELSRDHHHHLVCISCKVIKDIPMQKELNLKEQEVIKKMGFKPIGHSLEFFGVCRNCQ